MSLKDLMKSNEPLGLDDGIESLMKFSGVEVMSLETRQVLVMRGPVDLAMYGPIEMKFTNPRTRLPDSAPGIRFLVSELDGDVVDMPWNVISKRVFTQLQADLESGAYTTLTYGVQQSGKPPRTKYAIRRLPPVLYPIL